MKDKQSGRLLAAPLYALVILTAAGATAQQQAAPGVEGPVLYQPVAANPLDIDLRRLPKAAPWTENEQYRVVPDMKESGGVASAEHDEERAFYPDAAMPGGAGPATMTTPSPVSFDGIQATGWVPPDPVGDIGPNHYIQAVNTSFEIFDRAGNVLAGPSPTNALFTGFGGPCETSNNGDPIVRYDHLANRWLVSQFAFSAHMQCVAISKTGDPVSGGWFRYAFPTAGAPDYPKIGVWPDGYYMGTQRGFPGGGTDVYAFDRQRMLAGLPAAAVQFFVSPPSLFLQPSDLDGTAPPAGSPNFFVRMIDGDQFGGVDRLEVFAFSVNWAGPTGTFTQVASLPTAPFDAKLCGSNFFGTCVPQPGTGMKLETLPAWLMWRLQYRNFGTHETLMTNHTINTGGDHAGIRWYELRRTGGGPWSIFQQGDYSPDTAVHRWMGSVAMNKDGCVALGFSAASGAVSPSIRYAGRAAADPAGTLPTGDVTLIAGSGSQTGAIRWGNYSTMDVDPVDDSTFWYTTEYYSATSSAGWRTRVSSFTLPSCVTPPPPAPAALNHQVAWLVGGLLNAHALPLTSGFDTTFLYRRNRFLPFWSWEAEVGTAFANNGLHSGVLGTGELRLVRHLNAAPSKVRPFLLGGIGISRYATLGLSDTAPVVTLGAGTDFEWTQHVGFRVDLRAMWLHGMINPGWTTNWQVLWGPSFSF
jgi:hypothetical protein